MSNTPATPKKTQTFVDQKSIRNFAGASSALTILLNVIMLVYAQIKPSGIPNPVLAGLAVFLCLAYSLSFLKRGPALSITEYIWLTALNSAILFSSLTGINSILKKAGEAYASQNAAQVKPPANPGAKTIDPYRGKMMEASFGLPDLKNILIPKQAWFNPSPANTAEARNLKKQANVLTAQALQTVTKTETALNKVIITQNISNQKTDSLAVALHDLREQYIQTLAQLNSAQATIGDLNQKLKACAGSAPTVITLTNLQKAMESSKLQQAEQQKQQVLQLQLQPQRQLQQKQQKQLIQLQQQQVRQVKYNIQKQQQEQIH